MCSRTWSFPPPFVANKAFVKLIILFLKCDSVVVDRRSPPHLSLCFVFLIHTFKSTRSSNKKQRPHPVDDSVVLCSGRYIIRSTKPATFWFQVWPLWTGSASLFSYLDAEISVTKVCFLQATPHEFTLMLRYVLLGALFLHPNAKVQLKGQSYPGHVPAWSNSAIYRLSAPLPGNHQLQSVKYRSDDCVGSAIHKC